MRSTIETSAKRERPRTPSNAQRQSSAANGTQFMTEPYHKQEYQPPEQQQAQQRDRLVSLGTSAVVFAHELGNPLQAIFGSVELIENELKQKQIVDPFMTSVIQGAMREINRLRGLLQDFRSLAKTQTLKLQRSDLVKIVEEVLALQESGCQAAGVAVKLVSENPLPPVLLDKGKITQAVLNLCKNAVEAMPQGGCLSIRLYPSGSMVVMEFADNGVGVPGDMDVFQLFNTTKPDGSGLGLAIVRQIVTAHKGTINYMTQPGGGTSFTVSLPMENRNGTSL